VINLVINATIAGCLLIIIGIFYLLYRHGEFDDFYYDVPEQRFTTRDEPRRPEPVATNIIQSGPDEYVEGKFIIRAPQAKDLVPQPEDEAEDDEDEGEMVG